MTRRLRRLKKSRQWTRSRKQERRDGKRRREEIVARGEAGAAVCVRFTPRVTCKPLLARIFLSIMLMARSKDG